jgi:hypothetical protein
MAKPIVRLDLASSYVGIYRRIQLIAGPAAPYAPPVRRAKAANVSVMRQVRHPAMARAAGSFTNAATVDAARKRISVVATMVAAPMANWAIHCSFAATGVARIPRPTPITAVAAESCVQMVKPVRVARACVRTDYRRTTDSAVPPGK